MFSLCHLLLQVIACLDVRTNDRGDLVVTKGDQYDVRERSNENEVYYSLHLCVCALAGLPAQSGCTLYLIHEHE